MSGWKILAAGNVPFLAVAIVCAGAFAAGRATVKPHDRIAVAEQGAVVLEAVLARGNADTAQIDREIRRPLTAVLEKYASDGYAVIDVSRNDQGLMGVSAVPRDAIDISDEMRRAVNLPAARTPAASAPAAREAASGSKP